MLCKMKKGKSFIVPLIVYPFDVVMSFSQTDKQVNNLLQGQELEEEEIQAMYLSDTTQGRSMIFSTNLCMIRMRDYPDSPLQKGFLAHEIFHIVSFLFWRIKLPLHAKNTGEAYAFLTGYLTEEIYKRL